MYIVVWKGYIYQWKVRILDHVAQIVCFRICLFNHPVYPVTMFTTGKFRANF